MLKILGWAGTGDLAETKVKILFPSKVISQSSGGIFLLYKAKGRSCL